jgi:cytidylate kinase
VTAPAHDAARGSRLIAIDGPSGTGKSTVARAVARTLGYGYLDTGALYRIVTLHVLQAGIDPADDAAVAAARPGLAIAPPTDPDRQQHRLDGVDVAARIRADDVTAAVSAVAANPAVRAFLLGLQREIAYGAPMVVEGRDIGTVIAPDAAVKIYLTADAAVRASRRLKQNAAGADNAPGGRNGSAGPATIEAVRQDLARRDTADSTRVTAPLEAAADAVPVDSTHQSIDETTAAVLAVAAERGLTLGAVQPAGSLPVTWFHLHGENDPVPAGRRPRNVDRGRRIGIALSHLMYRMTVHGEEHMPASGPLVVVANHTTFADGPMLFGRLPRRISFLVKAEVLVGPLGWLLRTVGQYAIDRAAPQREVLLAALAQLKEGGVIGIFPEGQRTDGSVNEVFRGAGWLAARAGATVVPVALRGTARPAGRRMKRFRPRVHVLVGKAFTVPRGAGRTAIDAATADIQAHLSGLVADLDRGLAARNDYRRRYGRGWRRA